MFALLGRDFVARLLSGDQTVTDFYNRLYAMVTAVALAILVLSFVGDVAGHNWINIAIIPLWVLAVLYIKYYPRAIAGVLAVSTGASVAGLITSVKEGYEKWDNFTKHAALFGGVFGLTRFLVPIKAYPFMGLLLLGALITLGFYAWVWPTGKAYKRYVLGIVLVSIAIGVFGAFTGKSMSGVIPSWKKSGGSEWVTVARVTCSPTWNQDRGWCTVVTDAAKGTYRVIPRYKSWQLFQSDDSFIAVPPHGIDIYANWKDYEEFIDEFHRAAQKKDSNNYGALVVRIGDTEVIEALNASRNPREFEVTKDGTELAVTPNLAALPNPYKFNKGEIIVEVQRQD